MMMSTTMKTTTMRTNRFLSVIPTLAIVAASIFCTPPITSAAVLPNFHADCEYAVSVRMDINNSECKLLCQAAVRAGRVDSFAKQCTIEPWHHLDHDTLQPYGDCFHNWIHGHDVAHLLSNDLSVPPTIVAVRLGIHSPSGCQELCQKTAKCAAFTWTVASPDAEPLCWLQSSEHQQEAQSVYIGSSAASVLLSDDDFALLCPLTLIDKCRNGSVPCQKVGEDADGDADTVYYCIWKSPHHLSGPKLCDHPDSPVSPNDASEGPTTYTPTIFPEITTSGGSEGASPVRTLMGAAIAAFHGISVSNIPPSDASDCPFAVSTDMLLDNAACSTLCLDAVNSGDNSHFLASCTIEAYLDFGSQVFLLGTCFEQNVYGYDTAELSRGMISRHFAIKQASDCQQLCQDHPDCDHFIHQPSVQICVIKRLDHRIGAIDTLLPGDLWHDPPPGFVDYCPTALDQECNAYMKSCIKCFNNEDYRCVHNSVRHITGPKNCSAPLEDACLSATPPEPTTSTEATTRTKDHRPESEGDCEVTVSFSFEYSNSDCRAVCRKALQDDDEDLFDFFAVHCGIERHTTRNELVTVQGVCFDQWVLGYSDQNKGAIQVIRNVPSPAECQDRCVENPDCASFLWQGAPVENEETCMLKSYEMVEGAINTKIDGTISNPDEDWLNFCFLEVDLMCFDDAYECLRCGNVGPYSCVWKTKQHVSGPRHCAESIEICPTTSTSTTTTTSTTSSTMTTTTTSTSTETTTTTTSTTSTTTTTVTTTTSLTTSTTTTETTTTTMTTTTSLTTSTTTTETTTTTTTRSTTTTTTETTTTTKTTTTTTTTTTTSTITKTMTSTTTATEFTSTDIADDTNLMPIIGASVGAAGLLALIAGGGVGLARWMDRSTLVEVPLDSAMTFEVVPDGQNAGREGFVQDFEDLL